MKNKSGNKIAAEQIPPGEELDYYWLQIKCRNCFYSGSVAFEKGVFAEGHACPKCNCLGLEVQKPPFN